MGLRFDVETLASADPVYEHAQRPGCGDPRVFHPQGSGSRVARVGERGFPGLDQARVQLGEALDRKEDLPADLHLFRERDSGAGGQRVRDSFNGTDVESDVLPGPAVTSGQGLHQPALLVEQIDRQAIDLQLAQVVQVGTDRLLQPLGPGPQFVQAEHVVQAEHSLQMVNRIEVGGERAADLLAGRVRGAQGGELFLNGLQLMHQASNSPSEIVGVSRT